MKKIAALLAAFLVMGATFAQGSRKLISGVYNFATEPSELWTILEPNFVDVDPVAEKYVFTGSFTQKAMLGLSRYDFTCTVSKQDSDFSVVLSDMSSYACDKNFQKLKKGSVYKTSEKVASEYAKQIKEEIQNRMAKWSDDEYSANLDKAVTAPLILGFVAKKSALVFKKFVADYELIGKKITTKINVTKVDEAPKYAEGYAYYVAGSALAGYRKDSLGINFPEYVSLMVYTNNDSVISLTPAETLDGLISGGKSGSVYEVNGTIKEIKRDVTGKLSLIQVNE